MSPFDYLNSINTTKQDIMNDDLDEKNYPAFMINRSLSYFNDTVLLIIDYSMTFILKLFVKEKGFLNGLKKISQKILMLLKNIMDIRKQKHIKFFH